MIKNVTIIGVPCLDKYKACVQCKARVEQQTPPLARCSKVDFCLCTTKENKKKLKSHAYGEVVCHIAGVDDVSAEVLLRATKLDSMTLIRDF